MRITPLVLHAAQKLPSLTPMFSDALPVDTIEVVQGGTSTLNCTAAHGVTVGTTTAVCITEAETPNPITGVAINSDGDLVITTQFEHDFTTTPNPFRNDSWDTAVKVSGFDDPLIDGARDLSSAPDRVTLVVVPGGVISVAMLTGDEVVLKELEREITGWHVVTAETETTLTFATPSQISRSYTVQAPAVVQNIRIFGSLDAETVVEQYVRADGTAVPSEKAVMFITPVNVKTGRSANAVGDGIADISAGSDHRLTLLDGFEVHVVLPSEHSKGAVGPIDLAQGSVFSAVLGTFQGLKLSRPELCSAGSYVAILESHGVTGFTGANYMHRYVFQSPAYITNADAVPPYDYTDIPASVIDGTDPVPGSLQTVGAPAFRGIDFDKLIHEGHPSPLTATFELDGYDS